MNEVRQSMKAKMFWIFLALVNVVILFVCHFAVHLERGRLLAYSRKKVCMLIITSGVAVYVFAFLLFGIECSKLMLVVYLMSPVLLDIWKVGRQYRMEER
ncbi:MAG: hypothetical protein IJV50_11665 [Lachnospiraceae bacterium]|nr:hypothetical protein [Lachnospiraceae bacterium]